MKKYLTEFIGTFFLVLTIGCTVLTRGVIPPLAIGSVLTAFIFAGGHISGAHYNPVVTLAAWFRGRCATNDVIPYIISQIAGALLAAVTVNYLKAGSVFAVINPEYMPTFLAEFLFTFALVYVILNVATARETAGNSYYGLAIGLSLLAGAFAVGSISGAAFNPAVALALPVMGLLEWQHVVLYILAQCAAGLAAAWVFLFTHPNDH